MLAVTTLYGKDSDWEAKLRAGTATFDGTPGWHQALQEFVDMNTAGCFQPGATGASTVTAAALFAQGQGLMLALGSGQKALIDGASPQFGYSHRPFPAGTDPNQTRTYLRLADSLAVNAHSSSQEQKAAQAFVDFVARPKAGVRVLAGAAAA